MLNVKYEYYEDLSKVEQEMQPDNGAGKECATYLRIKHNGKTINLYSDAMEPEDCGFSRDLNWIREEIEKAYAQGCDDCLSLMDKSKGV